MQLSQGTCHKAEMTTSHSLTYPLNKVSVNRMDSLGLIQHHVYFHFLFHQQSKVMHASGWWHSVL